MKAFSSGAKYVRTTTDEEVNLYKIDYLNNKDPKWAANETISNLSWLIPLAKDILVDKSLVKEYSE
jgi:hypothetical protein